MARFGLNRLSVSSLHLFVSDDKLYYNEMLSNGNQISFLHWDMRHLMVMFDEQMNFESKQQQQQHQKLEKEE